MISKTKINFFFTIFIVTYSSISNAQDTSGVQLFQINKITKVAAAQSNPWYKILDNETFEVGLYSLKSKGQDNQTPHNYDEIYYILDGKATLKVADKLYSVDKDSILYVRAGVEHKFIDIIKDLSILVLFPKAKQNDSDPTSAIYSLSRIGKTRNLDSVIWTPFHRTTTMTFGLYMMPKTTNGDSTQNHKVDEVNVVTNGSSKFIVDSKTWEIQKGDIIYVRKNQGHFFRDLNSDLDVLILFEKKSTQK